MPADVDLIIAGGGPAGMMAGLLFARAGCTVKVLEKHADFFRDFRGDTVHPSTMEILDQLGMLDRFLRRPHNRINQAKIEVAGREWTLAELSHLDAPAPFVAMMPQWDFLDFLRDEASAWRGFDLEMCAPVEHFLEEQGRLVGVLLNDGRAVRARLVIAADGRDSIVRQGTLPVEELGAPMDVFWFRLGKRDTEGEAVRGVFDRGRLLVLIDRADYWQCALVIPKGKADELKGRGIDHIREIVAAAARDLDLSELDDTEDLKLLSVSLDRLTRWHRPGLVAIGDAAHAMSPIGGIGINLAIQDAVAAANALAGPLARGEDPDPLLEKVQQRRMLPIRIVQAGQKAAQDRIIDRLLEAGPPLEKAPLAVRMLHRFPLLRRIPGRAIGLGFRREKVESPDAGKGVQPPPGP